MKPLRDAVSGSAQGRRAPATLLGLFAVTALVLSITAAVACWTPAHRPAGIDPVRVMRGE